MTDYDGVENAITAHYKVNVEDALSLPSAYGNDDDPSLPDDAQHARVSVVWGSERTVTLGRTNRSRGEHAFVVRLFIPIDVGRAPMNQLANSIKGVFRQAVIGDACFRQPRLVLEDRLGKWDRGNVVCPFFTTE